MSAHDGAEPAPAAAEGRRRRLVALLSEDRLDSEGGGDGGGGAGVSHDSVGPARQDSVAGPPAPSPRDQQGLRGRLERLCAITVAEVGVDGAGITVMGNAEAGRAGARDQLAATGALTRRLEDLQLTTGEGPCVDAYASGVPVLAPDLMIEATHWLGFAPEAIAAGATAVFSLPLQVGAVRLGTLDLHRGTAGGLSRVQLADALTLATLATEALLELAAIPDPGDDPGDDRERGLDAGWLPDVHAEVHQASGMVSARHGIDVGAALVRIRAYAFTRGEPIHDVARRLIDRDLVFTADPDDPETHDTNAHDDGPLGPDAPLESND